MFKYAVVVLALIACAAAKPGLVAPLAYSAPVVAAPGFVTATSSQVVARNYNGIAAAPVLAAAPIAAHYAAAASLAYSSPLVHSAPLVAGGHLGYASPLRYASAPLLW